MPELNVPDPARGVRAAHRSLPGALWVAIIALGVITVLTLASALTRGSAVALVAALGNLVLLVGLALGHRWAYVLVIVFSVFGVAVAFGKSEHQGLPVLCGNAAVVVPVLLSTRFFFPHHEQPVDQQSS